jgi:excinuclease UvrABC nuclease subunit
MLRMRPPAVLKVNLRNAYPRCYATRKIPVTSSGEPSLGLYYGPFASRKAADGFAERALDLFKVRRCQIKIRRDPEFPGCIYSEMKMCLAPCFAGCTKQEYDFEVRRLVSFLETGGKSLRENLQAERNCASEDLDYEKAAWLHKKLDKLDDALRGQPELPRRLQDLNAVILQRAVADQSIAVYQVRAGKLADPFVLSFVAQTGDPGSVEQLLREHIEIHNEAPGADLSEHLWLLARWFYSNPRQGEIFFRAKDWPYRRMMRACARLLAPPDAPQERPSPQPDEERGKIS